jgi:hypothetical protein
LRQMRSSLRALDRALLAAEKRVLAAPGWDALHQTIASGKPWFDDKVGGPRRPRAPGISGAS